MKMNDILLRTNFGLNNYFAAILPVSCCHGWIMLHVLNDSSWEFYVAEYENLFS